MNTKAGIGLLLALWTSVAIAGVSTPAISIIIDDLGYLLTTGLRVVALPGSIACSILPQTPYAAVLAKAAHRAGKDVMLHLPMESQDGTSLGPGGIRHTMTHVELIRIFQTDLAMIPYVVGVNNHMGSLLTRQPIAMAWLMEEIKHHHGLFFIDSRTTTATIALKTAQSTGITATRRDVFLDNNRTPAAIRMQFSRLVALARIQGTAIGIGHPHPATLQILEELLPRLATLGVALRPISETVARRSLAPALLEEHNPYGPLPDIAGILKIRNKK